MMASEAFLLRVLKEKIEVLNGDRGDPLMFALRQSQISAVQEVSADLLATAATINKNLAIVKADVDSYVTYDALLSRSVEDSVLTAPPVAPGAGLMWSVPTSATGAWSGRDGDLAIFLAGAWVFVTPDDGVPFHDKTNSQEVVRSGTSWVAVSDVSGIYDFEASFLGTPLSSQVIYDRLVGRNVSFLANMGKSIGSVGTAPTASYDLDVRYGGVSIGTITISVAGLFSFVTVGGLAVDILAGSLFEIIAPATVDATISDIKVTLFGNSDRKGVI